jgi:hypothetical protein
MGFFYEFSLKKGLFLLKMGFFGQKCPQSIGGILRYFRPILRLIKATKTKCHETSGHFKNH